MKGSEEPDFRSLIDYLDGIAIWVVSDPGEFDYISAGAEDIWGISAETIQKDPSKLLERVHPDDLETVLTNMETAPEQIGEESYESRAVQPDGTIRWVHTRQVPVRDSDGTLQRVVGICTDTTTQKRREQEFEALNRVLRHDIRNDMSVILGWGEFLESHVDSEGAELLEKILSAGDHVVELTKVAREYAETIGSEAEMDLEPVSLRETLEREIEIRRGFFSEAEFIVDGEIPDVQVRANEMLSSVFRNLLNNAVQHNHRDEPSVEIRTELQDDSVLVQISDNGPGISPEMKDALFEQGQKGIDSAGTGMGLFLVSTLLKQYGGEIRVTDNSPTGTTFHVELARAD